MKIFITGGSGLLGQYLNKELSKENEILSLYNSNVGNCSEYPSIKTDLTNNPRLKEIFLDFKPNIVVHTASISKVDLADSLPVKYVSEINVDTTIRLAELCKANQARLIFTSTDLVYDGNAGSKLSEESEVNPVSFYAKTKLMAENAVKIIFDNYIILRTALLFGFGLNHSRNHFQQMYENIKNGKEVKLFYDQFRTPLALPEAARFANKLLKTDFRGVLNFGGKERVSRYELGEMFCEISGFDKNKLIRTSMFDMSGSNHVKDVSMNTDLLSSLGLNSIGIRKSIQEILGHG